MLSDKQIIELVDQGAIGGVPASESETATSSVQASSLDLHIDGIYLPRTSADEAGGANNPLTEYNLQTGETVLVRTREVLNLPKEIGGLAFPPSRFAVKALLVTNAGHVDPEYKGPLRFTIINMGHELQRLLAGDRVGTLILFRTDQPPEKGWFSRVGQKGQSPTTADLRFLSKDFVEVVHRAEEIAKRQVERAELELKTVEQRLTRRLGWGGVIVTLMGILVGGFFSWYSPVTRLETKVDTMQEAFGEAKQTDERLKALEASPKNTDLEKTLQSLSKRVTTLERKVK